jgi:uncharacterized tellurite resistance protein B-like protein
MASFNDILKSAKDKKGASVCLILAWIMTVDNEVSIEERMMLEQIAEPARLKGKVDDLIALCLTDDTSNILLACKILRRKFNQNETIEFIGLCLSMVLVDKRLVATENHIMIFLIDFFSIPEKVLNAIFIEFTGRRYPSPGDPSSMNWWRSKSQHSTNDNRTSSRSTNKKVWAISILELEGNPSSEEIKSAYRRLAKIHHPDRYESLGKEASEAAKITFQRISDAYQVLTND